MPRSPSLLAMLHGASGIAASEFDAEFDKGRLYLSGVSDAGVPVMVTRKQADGLGEGGEERYLRHLVFTLESAAACTTNGAEQWVWIIDLRGYSRANSPPISTSIATLKVFADHYPERLRRAYIVDAPGIFSLLWRAVSPFVHAATRAKIAFVTSAEYRAAVDAADGQKLLDLDKKCLGFSEFYRHWLQPYDAAAYRRLLRDVCRRPAEPSLKARAGQSVAVDAEAHAA
ncbi:unnamed protein product [Pedinophyceae sp. YPF-701]|nr:unnamed protein product [Pedinophyceae sp. YPF-701]